MKIIKVIFIIIIFSAAIKAQSGSLGSVDARSMGMAKTYNTTAQGVFAIGINPANLLGNEKYSFNLNTVLPLPDISVKTGTNFLTIDDINYFFGGVNGQSRILTPEDKTRFNDLFSNGGFIFADAKVGLVSLSLTTGAGAFGISISDYAGARINFPQALIDIGLNGNTNNKTYSLNDSNVKSWWIRNYSLTYARDLTGFLPGLFSKFAAGFSIKLVQGFSYAGTDRVNTSFQAGDKNQITGTSDLRALSAFSQDFGFKYSFDSDSLKQSAQRNMGPFPSPAGKGVGFDFGISTMIANEWNVSLAVTDIGKINWDVNTAEFTGYGNIYFDDPTNQAQRDSLKDQITGKGKRIDGFSTQLATAFRFGISHYFLGQQNDDSGSLLFAFDYNQGFNDMPGNSTKPRFSLGTEWKPMRWLPYVRSGISLGGEAGFNWALGLGMDAGIVEFNFATSNMESLVAANKGKQISVALGSRWKF